MKIYKYFDVFHIQFILKNEVLQKKKKKKKNHAV